MKKSILLFTLLTVAQFPGCKYDDGEIWNKVNENDARIAALELWQTTVNGQISSLQGLVTALETNDHVTGVTPVTEEGTTVGFTITFEKGAPVTIHYSKDTAPGENGNSPVIAVKQDNDGIYYWTIDGDWLTDDGKVTGNKVPVTGEKGADGTNGENGQNGSTPKVAIGDDEYWYISADGTATGTPPATGWTNTGIKATGPEGIAGPQGGKGDSMFSDIDNTHEDYLILKLALDETAITLPKYKVLGMTFPDLTDFALILDSQGVGEIEYTVTGDPAGIGIASVIPEGWQITIDEQIKKILISGLAYGNAFKILVVLTSTDGATASYWLQIIPPIEAVLIQAGTFQMGSPEEEPRRTNNETQHSVTLTGNFYMGKYEITNAQYAEFLNENGIQEETIDRGIINNPRYVTGGQGVVGTFGKQMLIYSSPNDSSYDFGLHWDTDKWVPVTGYENSPVIFVSQYGAMAYAEWVGGMLPTEAQWEYACRAGTTTAYSFGTAADDSYLNFRNNSKPLSVGSLLPNPWGLYDMHGNVYEWCADWYHVDYGMSDPTAPVIDPTGPATTTALGVARGGSWMTGGYGQGCRSASRIGEGCGLGSPDTGFRVIFPVN